MKFIKRRFNIDSCNETIEIDLYADTHLGSASVDGSLLRKHIQETKDEGRLWAFLGDGIDGIIPSDRRFDSKNMAPWAWDALRDKRLISAEYDYFAELFKPIASQCLFYLAGDGKHNRHENVADCRSDMLASIGIPGPYQTVYLATSTQRQGGSVVRQDLVFHHGYFAGRTSGAKMNNLERCLSYFPEAVGFFCGHGHTKATAPPLVGIVMRGKKGQSLYRRAAMVGSYLRTYSEETTGYGEVKFYPPVALGRITVRLAPHNVDDQKRIEVFNN